jgi:hypothetical protein
LSRSISCANASLIACLKVIFLSMFLPFGPGAVS